MTTTLIFQTFCNSVINTWYLSFFFCYLMCVCVCLCVYHLSLHCKWCFLHSNQCTSVPTLSWRFLYWLLGKIEHALTMCVKLCLFITESSWSTACLINWVFDGIYSQSLFLSWHKRLSVSRLSSPRFSHCHLFPSSVLLVSIKNWPWRAFSFHSIRYCFFPSCLFYKLFKL